MWYCTFSVYLQYYIHFIRNQNIQTQLINSSIESVDVTAEDMEVYRMKKVKADDPMAALLDSEEILEYKK